MQEQNHIMMDIRQKRISATLVSVTACHITVTAGAPFSSYEATRNELHNTKHHFAVTSMLHANYY